MRSSATFNTPGLRANIHHKIKNGSVYRGSRHGIKMELSISDQPDLEGNRIAWRARIDKTWHQGSAGTVYDALEEIRGRSTGPRILQALRVFKNKVSLQ